MTRKMHDPHLLKLAPPLSVALKLLRCEEIRSRGRQLGEEGDKMATGVGGDVPQLCHDGDKLLHHVVEQRAHIPEVDRAWQPSWQPSSKHLG